MMEVWYLVFFVLCAFSSFRRICFRELWKGKTTFCSCRNSTSVFMLAWALSWRIWWVLINRIVLGFYCLRFLNQFYTLNVAEFELIQREETLQFPPKPPTKRNWWGSIVTPFAGNNMLVLYSCVSNNSSKYFVKVLHNERPTPVPVSFLITFLWTWTSMVFVLGSTSASLQVFPFIVHFQLLKKVSLAVMSSLTI